MRVVLLSVLVLLAVSQAHALGLGYDYLEDNTLPLAPGATYYFKLVLQNEQTEELTVNLTVESDIARLEGESIITIPAESYDTTRYINITMPLETPEDEIYSVRFIVMPAAKNDGQVPFSVRYDRAIKVIAKQDALPSSVLPPAGPTIESPQSFSARVMGAMQSGILTILLGILLAGLLLFIWRKSAHVSQVATGASSPRVVATPTIDGFSAVTPVSASSGATSWAGVPASTVDDPLTPAVVGTTTTTEQRKAGSSESVAPTVSVPSVVPFAGVPNTGVNGSAVLPATPIAGLDTSAQTPQDHARESSARTPIPGQKQSLDDIQTAMRDSVLDTYAPASKRFYLSDGKMLGNLRDLRDALSVMPDNVYSHHVSNQHNDFCIWVGDALGLHDLAARMLAGRSPKETRRIIDDELA